MNTHNIFYNSIKRRSVPFKSEYPICVRHIYGLDLFSAIDCQGIYFLFNDELVEPVYVGKSKKIGTRIRQHYSGGYGKPFSYFTFVNLDDWDFEDIGFLEKDLIKALNPIQNIARS